MSHIPSDCLFFSERQQQLWKRWTPNNCEGWWGRCRFYLNTHWNIRSMRCQPLPFSCACRGQAMAFFFFFWLLLFHSFTSDWFESIISSFSSLFHMRSAWLWLQPEAFSKPFSSQDRQTPPINLSAFRLQERKHKNRSDEAAEWLCSRPHISFLATRQRQTGLMIKHNQPFILWDLVCCDISNTVTTLLPSWRLKTVFIAGMRLTLERTDDSSGNTDEWGPGSRCIHPKNFTCFSTDVGLEVFFELISLPNQDSSGELFLAEVTLTAFYYMSDYARL